MDANPLVAALRAGGWTNIMIGVGHWIAMVRLREISEWVGGPSVDQAGIWSYALTLGTGAIFIVFGLYALSAVGDIRRLPFSTPVVVLICWIFLLRAVGGTGMGGFIEDVDLKTLGFSVVALVVGVLYGLGARALLAAL